MIERLLPDGVAVAEIHGGSRFDGALTPAEAEQVAGVAPRRQAEFGAGRACARSALCALGVAPVTIPTGPAGEPRWPTGVVGSITHCHRYAAAAVGRSQMLAAIGIDAEPDRALPAGILAGLATPDERAALPRRSGASDPHWDRLLFSAKEAVFKAWYPLTGCLIGFDAATVVFDPAAGTWGSFEVRLAGGPIRTMTGRWLAEQGLIACAVCVERPAQAAIAASTSSRAARVFPLTNESTWGRAAAIPPTSGR